MATKVCAKQSVRLCHRGSLAVSLSPFVEWMASPLTTGRTACIKKINLSDVVVDMIKENWIFEARQQPVSRIDSYFGKQTF